MVQNNTISRGTSAEGIQWPQLLSLAALFIGGLIQLSCAQTLSGLPFDTTKYGRNDAHGRYIKVRGFNMYYETYGKGEPLIIIHGNGGSINNFVYQIPYFTKHFKVIVADSRAQGKSIDDSDSLTYEMMADDFNALLEKLHLDSCYVIGWSDGGINGLLLALRHPEKVKKLAITGANLWPDSTAVAPFLFKLGKDQNDTLVNKGEPTSKLRNKLKLERLLSQEPHIMPTQLGKIKCPTLVIGGDHDIILPQHTLLIAQSIPNSYLWIQPKSGHSVPITYSDQFNAIVDDFFRNSFKKIEGFDMFK